MSNTYKKTLTLKEKNQILFIFPNQNNLNSNNNSVCFFYKDIDFAITIYKNNTLLVQGKKIESFLDALGWDKQMNNLSTKPKSKINSIIENNNNPKEILIGSDEVGTGDLFGGIIVCAAFIKNKNIIEQLKITDSKNYNNIQIKELFSKIQNHIIYSKFELSPYEYNNLYFEHQNLNILKTLGHITVIKELQEKINNNKANAMIDQFCTKNSFLKYLKHLKQEWRETYLLETKAESKYLQVACASIVARYFFIQQIENLSKKYNLKLPFGSSSSNVGRISQSLSKQQKMHLLKMHFKNNI